MTQFEYYSHNEMRKIKSDLSNDQMAAFGISGKEERSFRSLFSSHPSIESRIDSLLKNS